jgi:MYXO-CTERM domain-containing protein
MRNVILLLILGASGPAFALKQSEHAKITTASCTHAGLPEEFCERVSDEVYYVDAYEWNDLAAHAQIDDGQTACTAANASRERLRVLGGDIRGLLPYASTSDVAATGVAVALGRSLHTLQDNCAHHGIPNPQHAWWSLSDQCHGTSVSPDITPSGIVCARVETDYAFAVFRSAADEAGVGNDVLSSVSSGATHWPSRGDVCHFMKTLSQQWDGTDRRWENATVVPALRAQLAHAMTTDDSSTGDVCSGGERVVAAAQPGGHVDTSRGMSVCFSVSAYCIGKADDVDEPPPWETEEPAQSQAAGCAVAGPSAGGFIPLLLLLGLFARRRSASAASHRPAVRTERPCLRARAAAPSCRTGAPTPRARADGWAIRR